MQYIFICCHRWVLPISIFSISEDHPTFLWSFRLRNIFGGNFIEGSEGTVLIYLFRFRRSFEKMWCEVQSKNSQSFQRFLLYALQASVCHASNAAPPKRSPRTRKPAAVRANSVTPACSGLAFRFSISNLAFLQLVSNLVTLTSHKYFIIMLTMVDF